MNITTEQARKLLDGATPGPWDLLYRDTHPNAVPTNIEADGYCLATYDDGYGGDPEWSNPGGDLPLISAAPALAQTVVEQAEKLRNIRVLAERLAARHEREDHGENAHETALFDCILGKKEADQ